MQLEIVNPEAGSLHEALGISEERSNEICDSLDFLMENCFGKTLKLHDHMQAIAALCLTKEELVWAVFTNARWLEKGKMLLSTH